jgi:DNA-damage-inducible protein D
MAKKAMIAHAAPMAVFKGRQVRRIIHDNEWWFSIVDVVAALTDSVNARDYWFKMKIREKDEAGVELSTICRQLKRPIVSSQNYLRHKEAEKRLKA